MPNFRSLSFFVWPGGVTQINKQGNRGDMRKIHVTRQFFEASGRHGDLIEKTKKKPFLDEVNGNMCAKFQVCIVFRLARRRDTNKQTNTQTNIQVNLRISSAGCSPHVDFDRNYYHPYYLFVASLPPWR